MSESLALKPTESGGFLVKEEHIRKQLELLQNKYFEITTIKDALRVQSAAEALSIMARELEVHERYKADADVMVRRCEVRIGELSAALPKWRRGPSRGTTPRATSEQCRKLRASGFSAPEIAERLGIGVGYVYKLLKGEKGRPYPGPSKGGTLAALGINPTRARNDEVLARLPDAEKERLIKESSSVGEMWSAAGVHPSTRPVPFKFAMALIAELENRRIRPSDPVLDALVVQWNKLAFKLDPRPRAPDGSLLHRPKKSRLAATTAITPNDPIANSQVPRGERPADRLRDCCRD